MKSQKAGFTLIELLVVIAIIALLMAILMPALSRVREVAKRSVCSSQVKQVGVGMTAYTSDYDGRMPPYNSDITNANPYELIHSYALYRSESLFVDSTGKPLPMKLAVLYENKYIADPKVFYCPSNILPLYRFESYNNPMPWGTLPQYFNSSDGEGHNQWVRMGYTYLPIDPRAPIVGGTDEVTAKNIDSLDPYVPYMTDLIRHKEEISHQRQGSYAINALFKDGHVTLCNDRRVFEHDVWNKMEYGQIDELPANYIVMRLIGGKGLNN